ncbi:hypothetical protein N7450_006028 [Penicillium hetheringtonii]|uniref:Uncharacterized protein n=1 Tax=Penicillium hetheringtonii TaxID=911720 RepID=A0AAD6DJH7_9EURO|nr:hypothetical protein N7450_006028 [Penicillium hetheringtonii]
MPSQFPNEMLKNLTVISQGPGWRPSYLRRRILTLFLLTFGAIIVALELLYRSSNVNNGIAASKQDIHYLWTYGPTAILTIITTFWSRVEYQAKQSAPWRALHDSPQPAEKSVLLDYISDLPPVAIWKSLKNKHFPVASSITCFLLLRLIIVFSTSLFLLQDVQVQRQGIPINIHEGFSTHNSKITTVGSQPYDILNGIIFDNVTYPMGTTENLTFQEFSTPSLPDKSIVIAPIDGLMAEFDCEAADLNIRNLTYLAYDGGLVSTNFDVGISSTSCTISKIQLLSGTNRTTAVFQGGKCGNSNSTDAYRIVLSIAEPYERNITPTEAPKNRPADKNKNWRIVHLGIKKSISMICTPSLSSLKLEAEGNATEQSSSIRFRDIKSEKADLTGLTAGDIAEFVVENTTSTRGFRPVEDSWQFSYYASVDTGYNLGLHLLGANLTVEALWQEGMLEKSANAFYRAVTALLMHMGLAQRTESTAFGSAIVHENRVVMIELPLRGMEVCLAIVMTLTISMILSLPIVPTTTWNPNHVSAMAAITANSHAFRKSLHRTGVVSHNKLLSRLLGSQYYSQSTPKGTSIGIVYNERDDSQLDTQFGSAYLPWKPFPNLVGRIVIFLLVLSAIPVLEILLRLSNTRDGIGDASLGNDYAHYLWTILPALIMVAISLFFGSLDFNVRCLAPYAPLTRPKGAVFERSLGLNFLDSLGLVNGVRSISSRHFAVQATTLATGASLFLTIVTSGLYSVMEVPFHSEVNFTRVGGFPDPRTIAGPSRNMNEAKETNGILTAEYILQYNFTYPRWTYEDLAFAEVSIDKDSLQTSLNESFVDVRVPALRLAPVCKIQTAADLMPNLTEPEFGSAGSHQLTYNQLRLACPGNNTNTRANLTTEIWKTIGSEPFGYSSQSQCSVEPGNNNGLVGASHYTTFYLWGYLHDKSIQHIMGLSCIQYAETVEVQTRFQLPGMDIDETFPPVPDESSAKLAPDLYTPIPEWWILNANGQFPKFDGFFQDLTSGRYAVPIEDFKTEKNDERVVEAIKFQHKLISAQQFNNYTRGTANDSVVHPTILGNITTSNRLRVIQDPVSTRILEGLLAFILVLGILGSVLLNTDRVLPKNPCSIAAVASLLVDSQFLEEFLAGAWDPEDKKLGQKFPRKVFHLGWWECGEENSTEIGGKVFTIDHRPMKTESVI